MSYGIITHYTLYYNNGSMFNAISTENMYTISPLSPYQTVSVRISASTSVGEGPQSTSVDFTSDEASKYSYTKLFSDLQIHVYSTIQLCFWLTYTLSMHEVKTGYIESVYPCARCRLKMLIIQENNVPKIIGFML